VGKDPLLDVARITAKALAEGRVIDQPPQPISVSFLQEFFDIDYPRAVRLMKQLEKEGSQPTYIYPKQEPVVPPAMMRILKRMSRSRIFWVFAVAAIMAIVSLILWHTLPPETGGWGIGRETAVLITLTVGALTIGILLGQRRSKQLLRIIACKNCGAKMTYKRFLDNGEACIHCGSDLYKETDEYVKRPWSLARFIRRSFH